MSPGAVAVDGPGTRAIDRRVDRIDAAPEHHRYRPAAPHRFKGGGPVREVTTHRLRRPDHWHLVTYGLSELDVKESDDPATSGWGFELTFRLAAGPKGVAAPGAPGGGPTRPARRGWGGRGSGAGHPPADGPAGDDPEPLWAVDLLANLAAYVWTSGHPFSAGHHIDLRGPIRIDGGGDLTAAVIVVDPALGVMDGPFGTVEFLQVVAVTADELELCRSWGTDRVVEVLQARDPLLVTELDRRSILTDPAVRADADGRGGRRPANELRVASLRWRLRFGRVVAQLGAGAAAALGPALRRHLVGDGASFRVVGDDGEVRFVAAEVASWTIDGARLQVAVPPGEVESLASLFDGRTGWGHRAAWAGLRWRVVA